MNQLQYSPPLIDVGQYRAGSEGELLRERQHGRQELLDNAPRSPEPPVP
jgi:hypothetical protein